MSKESHTSASVGESVDESVAGALSPFEQVQYARDIIQLEGDALLQLAARLDVSFCHAVEALYECRANVIVTGMGKAGLIGQKIAATLASTGTRSHFLHPAEAFHGDLGRIHRDDVLLVLSHSGETEEIVRLITPLSELGVTIVAITRDENNTLARSATFSLHLGPLQEACALGLAPSTSTTAMLALGDALALVASRMKQFSAADFARFHPGGNLGRQLSKVDQHMRPLVECRVAPNTSTVRDVLVGCRQPARRSGAIMLLDDDGRLAGIFTDSDLARLFERRSDQALDQSIGQVMTAHPLSVPAGSMIVDAVTIMAERKISELPVLDQQNRPVGLLDITDLVNGNLMDMADMGSPEKLAQTGQPNADITAPPARKTG